MALPLFLTNCLAPSCLLVSNPNPNTSSYIISPSQISQNSRLIFTSDRRLRFLNSVVNAYDEDSEQGIPPESEVDNIGVKAALSVLKFYKREISPVLPKSCRYVPTCSEYSMIAYKKYGFMKGSALTVWRICRCNPLGGTGFDPPRWFGESDTQDH